MGCTGSQGQHPVGVNGAALAVKSALLLGSRRLHWQSAPLWGFLGLHWQSRSAPVWGFQWALLTFKVSTPVGVPVGPISIEGQHPCRGSSGLYCQGQHLGKGSRGCIGSQGQHPCSCTGSQSQHPCQGSRRHCWKSRSASLQGFQTAVLAVKSAPQHGFQGVHWQSRSASLWVSREMCGDDSDVYIMLIHSKRLALLPKIQTYKRLKRTPFLMAKPKTREFGG